VIRRRGAPASALGAWVRVLLFVALFPVLVTEAGRAGLQKAWLDARGEPPAEHVTTLYPDRLEHAVRRGGRVLDTWTLELRELLAVSYSATLGYEAECTRRAPHLRLVGRRGTVELPFSLPDEQGAALRDVIVGGLLHVRTLNPSLELPGLHVGATRCPYCATLFQLEPGVRCPSCGAWAGGFMNA
jgi:hypothetical protein